MAIKIIRTYEATPNAIAQARYFGLYGDTAKRLARMAKRSAPITSPYGNRRFHDFILKIAEGKVLGVSRLYELNSH
jgi:hypothetical protein